MNLFDYTIPVTGEIFTPLLTHKNITINRIVSADTLEAKTYIQEEDEWVILLEGEAILQIEAKERKLSKGDSLLIPAKTPHKVLHTQQGTLWLTVHIS
jgi:cupin 2 domain-containing protein